MVGTPMVENRCCIEGFIHVVPLGSKSQFLLIVQELTNLSQFLGYSAIAYRSDNEPATRQILKMFKGSLENETSVLRTFKDCAYTTHQYTSHQYTTHHTPQITHLSSYTTHHTPLTIHHLSYTTHHYTTHHTPLIIHHSSSS